MTPLVCVTDWVMVVWSMDKSLILSQNLCALVTKEHSLTTIHIVSARLSTSSSLG